MESIKKLCADHAIWIKEMQESEYGDLKLHAHWWDKQLLQQLSKPNSKEIFEEIKILLIRLRSSRLKEQLNSVALEAKSILQTLEENPVATT